jgi:hypothetical protein
MKTIKVTIEGTTPLLMARYVHGYKTPKVVENEREECAVRLHTMDSCCPKESNGNGKVPVIPHKALYATLMNGGKYHKLGAKKITTQRESLIPAYAMITSPYMLVTPNKWEADLQFAKNAMDQMIPVYRPRFDKWGGKFEIEVYDPETFGTHLIRQILDDAGIKVGLLAYRPARKGYFGKFMVTGWEVS